MRFVREFFEKEKTVQEIAIKFALINSNNL